MIVGDDIPDGPKRADMESAPTDLSVLLNLMPVGEGSPLPTNLYKNGRRNASPTYKTSKFTTNLVGTDVLGGPKRADMESAPTDKT